MFGFALQAIIAIMGLFAVAIASLVGLQRLDSSDVI